METATITLMTDGPTAGEIALTINPKKEITILDHPLISKTGASTDKPLPKEYNEISVMQIITRNAGTALHAACRALASQWLCGGEKTDFSQRLFPDITSFAEFAKTISQAESWKPRHAAIVAETADALWQLGAHNLPKIELKDNQTDLKTLLTDNWERIKRLQAVMLFGLVELHPMFNRQNIITLPEVRFQPRNSGLSRLGKELANPAGPALTQDKLIKTDNKPVSINLLRALKFNDEEELHQWLYQVLVKQEIPFQHINSQRFNWLPNRLADADLLPLRQTEKEQANFYAELTKLFAVGYEKDFIAHFLPALQKSQITLEEMEALLALRVVWRAQRDMLGLIGGQTQVSRDDLIEILKIFPLADLKLETADDYEANQAQINSLLSQLPQEAQEIFAPIFISTDLLVLEMPEEKLKIGAGKTAFNRLKKYVQRKYLDGKSPCLYQDAEFFELLTEACSQGLKISIGDLKFSNKPIDEQIQERHIREFRFYNIVLFNALHSYLRKAHPDKIITIRDVLRHPIIKALEREFLVYCGIDYPQDKRRKPLPQMQIKTAISEPLKDLTKHIHLWRKIVKAMMVHKTAQSRTQLGAIAEEVME